jgi:hypothetical protein
MTLLAAYDPMHGTPTGELVSCAVSPFHTLTLLVGRAVPGWQIHDYPAAGKLQAVCHPLAMTDAVYEFFVRKE